MKFVTTINGVEYEMTEDFDVLSDNRWLAELDGRVSAIAKLLDDDDFNDARIYNSPQLANAQNAVGELLFFIQNLQAESFEHILKRLIGDSKND